MTPFDSIEPIKKHLVVISRFPPVYGGGGLRIERMYRRMLADRSEQVQVLTHTGKVSSETSHNDKPFRVTRIRKRDNLLLSFVMVGVALVRMKVWRCKSAHIVGSIFLSFAAIFVAKAFGLKIIRELTSDDLIHHPNPLKNWLIKKSYRIVDLVIVPKQIIADRVIKAGALEKNVWVRLHPVNIRNFDFPTPEERGSARAELGISDEIVLHLMIGHIYELKNQALAVDALAKMPANHKLLIAGPSLKEDEPYLREIRSRIAENRLEGRVTIKPEFVKDTRSLYWAADFYLMLSSQEGLPNVVLEALSTGIPVISGSNLGLEMLVKDGESGYNVSFDPQNIADAVQNGVEQGLMKNRSGISAISQPKFDAREIDRLTAKVLGFG